jgi:hypothetical protein
MASVSRAGQGRTALPPARSPRAGMSNQAMNQLLRSLEGVAIKPHRKSSASISSSITESRREKNTVRPSGEALRPKPTAPRLRATVVDCRVAKVEVLQPRLGTRPVEHEGARR